MTDKRLLVKLRLHLFRKIFMGLVLKLAEIVVLSKQVIKPVLLLCDRVNVLNYRILSSLHFFYFRFNITYGMNV